MTFVLGHVVPAQRLFSGPLRIPLKRTLIDVGMLYKHTHTRLYILHLLIVCLTFTVPNHFLRVGGREYKVAIPLTVAGSVVLTTIMSLETRVSGTYFNLHFIVIEIQHLLENF